MGVEVTYLEDQGIVFTKITGRITAHCADRMLAQRRRLSDERDCKLFLTDATEAEPDDEIADLFAFSNLYEAAGIPRAGRTAIVYPKDDLDIELYQSALVDRGWNVRVFEGMEEAKAWLLGPD